MQVAGEPFGLVGAEPTQVREVAAADEDGVGVIDAAESDRRDTGVAVAAAGEEAGAVPERRCGTSPRDRAAWRQRAHGSGR